MTLENLLEAIPPYAKDIKLNLSSVLKQSELSPLQTWGIALSTAIASRNTVLTHTLQEEAEKHTTPEVLQAARTAAALMGMNNVYYRFLHLTSNDKYSTIPARLRMQGIRTHGIEAADFELFCLAVSAINNCPACVSSHEKVVREKGLTEDQVLAAVRIAAVVHAAATVLDESMS